MSMMKDISRLGCPQNKYLIIDVNRHSYFANDGVFIIELPWKGESHDNRLVNTLDLVMPILREGSDLSRGMRLIRPRLMDVLRGNSKSYKNYGRNSQQNNQHKHKKLTNFLEDDQLSHASYLKIKDHKQIFDGEE